MKFAAAVATAVVLASSLASAQSGGKPLKIVAAENFYGDLAQQLGGSDVKVTSILSNPNQDPHTFEASSSTARDIADAEIIIYNGADYDPWMANLLSASRSTHRKIIIVADLTHRKSGDNPHLWYDPATMPALAKALVAVYELSDPAHKADYENRFKAFQESLQPMIGKMDEMRRKYAGLEVAATEPVFGYMADALGLKMRNRSFQMAVMNGTEPSASDVAAFENDLRTREVKVLFYNSQVADDLTARLQKLARDSGVPVVGITETQPAGASYQGWMTGQLDALEKALSGSGS
ncbi:MAG: zinc/manganese transport system substrate-binding protein [Rhodospirillaceae bacterium]|jgi:zinc/manganese transport system substrate-binding protein|nr:zinc/manganese transport system substrate-binding protein [Rhodospirillaceae bacterium]